MHRALSLAGIAVAFTIGSASTASAQAREIKTWPKHGTWQVVLVERPSGGPMCMLNGLGQDPHSFGVSFMQMPEHLLFMVDDRSSTAGYQPTMTVMIDGQKYETFQTFNDPPMTSTETHAARRVHEMIDRLAQGQMLSVEARHARYTLSLDGFADAAGQFTACRHDAAKLRRDNTTGRSQ